MRLRPVHHLWRGELLYNISSSWNPIQLRDENILKNVTDCGKAANDFLAGKLNLYIWSWLLFTELRNCSSKNVDFNRCQCIAAIEASNLASELKVKRFTKSQYYASQTQECSLLSSYKDDSLDGKKKCKKAVGKCKTAAVRFRTKLFSLTNCS